MARNLIDLTDMPDRQPVSVQHIRAGDIDSHRLVDAIRQCGRRHKRVTGDLLGHQKCGQPKTLRFRRLDAGVFGDRVQIVQPAIGGNISGLMQRHPRIDQSRIEFEEALQKHARHHRTEPEGIGSPPASLLHTQLV